MRKVLLLAVVGIALAVALALNGTSVLSRLAPEQDASTPSVRVRPPAEPTATPGAPVPGTVLTARPVPRRCPVPPCVPSGRGS